MQTLRLKLEVDAPAAKLYFIRYGDPEFHLRLRVKANNAEWVIAQKVVHDWLTELSRNKRMWKCELATYEREVERYGGEKMIDAAEEVFFRDSEFVLALAANGHCWAEHNRGKWMIKSVESLWEAAALTSGATTKIYKLIAAQLAARLDRGRAQRVAMALEFRQERRSITDFLTALPGSSDVHSPLCHRALEARNKSVADFARRFHSFASAGESMRSLQAIVESLAQMTVNRLARIDSIDAEWLIYEALARIVESERGRNLMSSSSMR